jgi:hypothetical protein
MADIHWPCSVKLQTSKPQATASPICQNIIALGAISGFRGSEDIFGVGEVYVSFPA